MPCPLDSAIFPIQIWSSWAKEWSLLLPIRTPARALRRQCSAERVLFQEPEFGVTGRVQIRLVGDLDLDIEQRKDVDKGGYDSYVFPVDSAEPVWHRILPEHLRMLNGGFRGEMVSEHRIGLSLPEHVMARCGLKLGIVALMECRVGKGRVVISRIQTRGRLVASGHTSGLYERRVDPVAQQFFLNLVEYTVANVTK